MRNLILSRCNLKALQLEEELGLPQHAPPPRLVTQPKDTTISVDNLKEEKEETKEEKTNNQEEQKQNTQDKEEKPKENK